MQKIISKYALAAHLAILAVAPLLLLPLAGSLPTATVVLWLSAFGFSWILMEPSRRRGEMLHDARVRVSVSLLRDPLFWFSFILVAYAGVRAINGGIALSYDAELMIWSVSQPTFSMLPGCADGSGYFCFSTVLGLFVVFQGVRHALGLAARVSFLFISSLISAVAAVVFAFAVSYHVPSVVALAQYSEYNNSFYGVAFGIMTLCSIVALFDIIASKWVRIEPLVAFSMIGNAIGMMLFSPPHVIVVFAVASILMLVISLFIARDAFEGSGSFRFALAAVMAIVAPIMYAMATEDLPWISEKISALKDFSLFSAGFFEMRHSLSDIAMRAWLKNPWLGTGLGSFPFDIRFFATAEDWLVISPAQKTAMNGWWQLLVERGVVGVGMFAVAVGMMLWTYFSRMAFAFSRIHFSPEHFLGLVSLVALVVLAFVDGSYLRPEVLMLAGTFLAFSGGAFPARPREDAHGKEK